MKQNVGVLDTAIRSVIAVICSSLAVAGLLPETGSILMAIIGALMWITSSTGVCLVYKMLGIDTYPGAGHGLTQYYPDV